MSSLNGRTSDRELSNQLSKAQTDIIKYIKSNQLKRRQTVNNFVTSAIRTVSPIIIGALVAWLASLSLQLDAETQTGLIVALVGVLQAVYYLVVRLLEKRWPQLGVLLGSASQPKYNK